MICACAPMEAHANNNPANSMFVLAFLMARLGLSGDNKQNIQFIQ
jgi:hypothetical protein